MTDAVRRFPRMGLDELDQLADAAVALLEDDRQRALSPDSKKKLRPWTGPEVAALLKVSLDALYRRLKKEPPLPQGNQVTERRREFTMEEIWILMEAFGIRPIRKPGDATQVWSICMFKGGVSKTTLALNVSQGLCRRGLRGLLIDLDPQASATQGSGVSPLAINEEDTIFPLLHGPEIPQGLREEEVAAIEARWTGSLVSAIRPTAWPSLDLLPASLALFGGDFEVANRAVRLRGFPFHRILANALEEIKKSGTYDYILFDTAPSLGFLNTIAIFAAEVLLVPVPPAPLDIHSAGMFFQTLAETIRPLSAVEKTPKEFEAVLLLVSKYKEGDKSHEELEAKLREKFKPIALKSKLLLSAALEKLGAKLLTPYETTGYQGGRRTLERVLESLDSITDEVRDVMVNIWECRRSEAATVAAEQALAPTGTE